VEMHPSTFTQTSFTVVGATTKSTGNTKAVNAIMGTVSFSGKTATFAPSSPLAEGETSLVFKKTALVLVIANQPIQTVFIMKNEE
jgi:hypothetical protein